MSNTIANQRSTPNGLISLIALLTGASGGFYGLVTWVALVLGCAVTTGTGAVGLTICAATLFVAGIQFLHLGIGLILPKNGFRTQHNFLSPSSIWNVKAFFGQAL